MSAMNTIFFQVPKVSEETLRKIVKDHNKEVLFVIPFGSQMYGTSHENSDIDVIMVTLPNKVDLLLQRPPEAIRKWYTLEGEPLESKNSGSADKMEVQFFEFTEVIHSIVQSKFTFLEVLSYLRCNYEQKPGVYGSSDIAIDFLFAVAYKMTAFDIEGQVNSAGKISDYLVKESKSLKTIQTLWGWTEDKLEQGFLPTTSICDSPTLIKEFLDFSETLFGVSKDGSLFNKPIITRPKFTLRELNSHLLAKVSSFNSAKVNAVKEGVSASNGKGLANALRFLIESKQLLTRGYIQMPLPQADRIRDIKIGKISQEDAIRYIEQMYAEVRGLMDRISNYPGKCQAARTSAIEFLDANLWGALSLIYKIPSE